MWTPDIENTVVGRYCMRIRIQHPLALGSLLLLPISFFLLSFYTALFEPTVEARPVSPPTSDPDVGTEDPPLYGLENEGNINYLILQKNNSAALSFLNKVFSSISPKGDKMYYFFPRGNYRCITCEMYLFFLPVLIMLDIGQSGHAAFQKP
jgi:hypothetical protein